METLKLKQVQVSDFSEGCKNKIICQHFISQEGICTEGHWERNMVELCYFLVSGNMQILGELNDLQNIFSFLPGSGVNLEEMWGVGRNHLRTT